MYCLLNENAGMVATATRTILENLDRIPNEDERTKVSIIAFDASIYFFSIAVRIRCVLVVWSFSHATL
jgi:hypothetical protein